MDELLWIENNTAASKTQYCISQIEARVFISFPALETQAFEWDHQGSLYLATPSLQLGQTLIWRKYRTLWTLETNYYLLQNF